MYIAMEKNLRPLHSTCFWDLSGDWMPYDEQGYTVYCNEKQLLNWVGTHVWLVETRGNQLITSTKTTVPIVRLVRPISHWNTKTARKFACDCVARALGVYTFDQPENTAPHFAITVARQFANDSASARKLRSANRNARTAASAADAQWAKDAAYAATLASSQDDYEYPVSDIARHAADAIASFAATKLVGTIPHGLTWDEFFDAERNWQAARLKEYLVGNL